MSVYAGVDGGGTKTLVVVVNEMGLEVGRGLAANANYQVLMTQGLTDKEAADAVAQRISEALTKALPDGSSAPGAIFAGLAGVDRLNDVAIMRLALADTGLCPFERWQVVNDAELVLYGLENGVGLGLIAGTGSIAVGRRSQDGKKARAGGWGHLLGDEGSGYEIGRAALQAATQAADKRGPATLLLPKILEQWKLDRPESLIKAVYNSGENRNQKIAQLANLVFGLACEDEVAAALAKKAALDLATAVWAVYQQLEFENEAAPALGLGGGLLLNNPGLKAGVLGQLQKFGYQPSQVVEVSEPAKAAAQAALQYATAKFVTAATAQ